jgi:hypothetical protein
MFNPFRDVNWRPDRNERRAFGRLLALGFLGVGLLLWVVVRWKTGQWEKWPLWLGGMGAALGTICWAAPEIARPIYVAWYAVGGVIGFVVSNLLLIAVFYLVITPIGLVMRVLGRDPLERKWDPGAASYWKDAEKPVDAKRYFRQF